MGIETTNPPSGRRRVIVGEGQQGPITLELAEIRTPSEMQVAQLVDRLRLSAALFTETTVDRSRMPASQREAIEERERIANERRRAVADAYSEALNMLGQGDIVRAVKRRHSPY